jgi:ABC-2 type transport system permease protein
MRKALAVAIREYRAAVQTKAFLVSLLLMPIICGFAIGIQIAIFRAEAGETKKHAVVDRTGQLRAALEEANARRTAFEIKDPETRRRNAPAFELVFVDPSPDDSTAIVAQRLALSERESHGEIEGFVEIGPDVFDVVPPDAPANDRHDVRFQSDKIAERDFIRWATGAINGAIRERRFARADVTPDLVRQVQTPAPTRIKGLTKRNPRTGAIEEPSDESQLASFFLPGVVVVMMLMLVLLGAVPAMQGIVEEKQQRIVEVLLGCLSPFELMAGKLVGVVGVAMTTGAVYLGGLSLVAARFHVADLLPASLVAWFALFTVLAVLVFGSLFMAVGAAASDLKETQSLQTPLVMVAMLPTLLIGPVMRDPAGRVAVVGSFVPFSAPMMMMSRLASTAEVPTWQPVVAAIGVLLTSIACVWAAGRVFRIGLLLQGKAPPFGELVRWVLHG